MGGPGGQAGFGAAAGAVPAAPNAPPGIAAPAFKQPAQEMARDQMERQQMGLRRLEQADRRRALQLREEVAKSRAFALPPLVVRQYAYVRSHGAQPDQRQDTTETVYWNPVLVMADGKSDVTFNLSDQVTSFEVTAYGHTLDGRLGTLTSTIESRLPVALEAKTGEMIWVHSVREGTRAAISPRQLSGRGLAF